MSRIKVNKSNHIKLFPVKKEESWYSIYDKFDSSMELIDWLVDNYNPPTKKN